MTGAALARNCFGLRPPLRPAPESRNKSGIVGASFARIAGILREKLWALTWAREGRQAGSANAQRRVALITECALRRPRSGIGAAPAAERQLRIHAPSWIAGIIDCVSLRRLGFATVRYGGES